MQPRSPMFPPTWPTGSPKLSPLAHRTRSVAPTRSRCGLGDRSARHRTTPRLEPSQRPQDPTVTRPSRANYRRLPTDRKVTLRTLEEPRRPQRAATPPARLDRQDRPEAVAGLSPQRRPPLRIRRQRRRGERRPRPLAVVGPSITTRIVHPPRKEDHETSRSDRSEPRTRPLPRTDRIHQHQIWLLTRIAFGFHGPQPLIALECSPSAATHHNSQAEPDPQIQQESAICGAFGFVTKGLARAAYGSDVGDALPQSFDYPEHFVGAFADTGQLCRCPLIA